LYRIHLPQQSLQNPELYGAATIQQPHNNHSSTTHQPLKNLSKTTQQPRSNHSAIIQHSFSSHKAIIHSTNPTFTKSKHPHKLKTPAMILNKLKSHVWCSFR
jgi:hypothetical protein